MFTGLVFSEENTDFYSIGEQKIEFRISASMDDFENSLVNQWTVLRDIHGGKQFVSDVVFDGNDVEGVWVERLPDGQQNGAFCIEGESVETRKCINPYKVRIWFKKSSWRKIRTATENYLGYGLAICQGKKIIRTVRIGQGLDQEVELLAMDEDAINLLLKGMKPSTVPSQALRKEEYNTWLMEHVQEFPSIVLQLESQAKEYMENKEYLQASRFYEKVLETSAEYNSLYLSLGDCYIQMRKYAEAESAYQKGLGLIDDLELRVEYLLQLGNLYYETEKYDLARAEYKKCITILQESNLEDKDELLELILETLENMEAEKQ